jgi:cation transport ATPase
MPPPRIIASGVAIPMAHGHLEELQAAGNTVVALAVDGEPAALIALADRIKDDAREAVERLKAAGLEPVMLTGDNERTARAVAHEVGISGYRAEVLPDDKAKEVRDLQEQGYRVVMVGDGINDAPALMQADVGIAIGAGTDIAIESADVVLVGERLGAVVDTYHIGKSSYRKTVQNISLAFAFNGIGVPLAVTGLVHPVWAMIAMAASVTTVLTNSFAGQLLPKARRGGEDRGQEGRGRRARLTLRVPNMRCGHCLESIREATSKLDGVEGVSGDLEEHEVTVTYREGEAEPDGIREAIIERGFQVDSAGSVPKPSKDEAA